MQWNVYILSSAKLNRYYTGCTHNLDDRLEQHRIHFFGNDSFTSKADDWKCILVLNCRDEAHAKAVEKHVKQMKSRKYIQNLIQYSELQKLIDSF